MSLVDGRAGDRPEPADERAAQHLHAEVFLVAADDGSRRVDFRLGDGEELHAEHPDTFEIPSRSQREGLRPGDLAKLLFAVVDPVGDEPGAERMWVVVQQVIGGRYVGTLDNEPYVITTIAADDPVEFGPEHVIQLWEDA